jgi:hypothetical protein
LCFASLKENGNKVSGGYKPGNGVKKTHMQIHFTLLDDSVGRFVKVSRETNTAFYCT